MLDVFIFFSNKEIIIKSNNLRKKNGTHYYLPWKSIDWLRGGLERKSSKLKEESITSIRKMRMVNLKKYESNKIQKSLGER